LILSKKNIVPLILFIFYSVGIFGISFPELRTQFVSLTPLNLLMTAFLLLWGNGKYNLKLIYAACIALFLGYGVEVLGVASGVLFGEYHYGQALGWELMDVPVVMGVNWLILSFSSLGIMGRLTSNSFLKVIMSSLVMVILDVLIEPVAIQLDFWTWTQVNVPLQNYIMWFFSALIINSLIELLVKEIHFQTSLFVFSAQIYFFTFLNIIL
tara:strand:- start:875 stop:1507 length:633 start_codon:yes stop_codon:yes gene_type:complete